jgi:hypothetical protein
MIYENGFEQDDVDDENESTPTLPWVIRADGSHEYPKPKNGRTWTLKELRSIVGGSIELLPVPSAIGFDKCLMVVNESGLPMRLPPNYIASILMRMNLVGDVLVCPDEMIP